MAYVYGLFYEDEEGDNVCFYIGKGTGNRLRRHFYQDIKGENPHKDHKIKNLCEEGREPYAEKIVDELTDKEAYKIEEDLLRRDDVFKNVTNLTRGGLGQCSENMSGKDAPWYGEYGENHPASDERSQQFKEKVSKSVKKTYENGRKPPFKGRSHSKETKQKLSKNRMGSKNPMYGKPLSEKHKKNISDSIKGSKNPNSNITKDEAEKIKWVYRNTDKTQKEVAKEYSTTRDVVKNIHNEYTWSHIEAKKP